MSKTLRLLLILGIIVLAGYLRWRAVQQLPVDYDEDDYLRAGQQYSTAFQRGDWMARCMRSESHPK